MAMTVGDLRKAIEGAPDDAKLRIEGEAWIEETSSGWIRVEAVPTGVGMRGEATITFRGTFGFQWERMR